MPASNWCNTSSLPTMICDSAPTISRQCASISTGFIASQPLRSRPRRSEPQLPDETDPDAAICDMPAGAPRQHQPARPTGLPGCARNRIGFLTLCATASRALRKAISTSGAIPFRVSAASKRECISRLPRHRLSM